MFELNSLTKKQLIQAFVVNLSMIQDDCFTPEGRIHVIAHMEKIQDAYTGKRGYGEIENEMMKRWIAKLK